jgi:hypothetical protein
VKRRIKAVRYPMPERFKRLADYNALLGTRTPDELMAEMIALQAEFDSWIATVRMVER